MSPESFAHSPPEPASPTAPRPPGDGCGLTDRQFAAYLRELPRLLAEGHSGRYALLKGDEVVSVWDTQRDVLQAGYERFGLDPFTVKKIEPSDPDRLAAIRATREGICPS
jgi:hypothetical protein